MGGLWVFHSEKIPHLPCSKSPYYNLGFYNMESLKEANLKLRTIVSMRMLKREKPIKIAQIAAYKLLAAEAARARLANLKIIK